MPFVSSFPFFGFEVFVFFFRLHLAGPSVKHIDAVASFTSFSHNHCHTHTHTYTYRDYCEAIKVRTRVVKKALQIVIILCVPWSCFPLISFFPLVGTGIAAQRFVRAAEGVCFSASISANVVALAKSRACVVKMQFRRDGFRFQA